jgi:hypothetical protein
LVLQRLPDGPHRYNDFAIAAAPSSVLDIGTFILLPDCPWMLQGLIGLAD